MNQVIFQVNQVIFKVNQMIFQVNPVFFVMQEKWVNKEQQVNQIIGSCESESDSSVNTGKFQGNRWHSWTNWLILVNQVEFSHLCNDVVQLRLCEVFIHLGQDLPEPQHRNESFSFAVKQPEKFQLRFEEATLSPEGLF